MQTQEMLRIFPRLLFTITTREEDEESIREVFRTYDVPVAFDARAQGTAPTKLLDILGLTNNHRLITIGCLPHSLIKKVFIALDRHCGFYRSGGGIAFTVPVSGTSNLMLQMLCDEQHTTGETETKGDKKTMNDKPEYALVMAAVVNGYSDDVIDAARQAGARGGTVIKSRRRNSEHAQQFFGISIQEEQDLVLMVVPKAQKSAIMTTISEKCGSKTPAQGILFSLPVEDTIGLEDGVRSSLPDEAEGK